MKQENKILLLKDLCTRLPYGIKASYYGAEEQCETWDEIESITLDGYVDIGQYNLPIESIKPYLFPLSSMTEEQINELKDLCDMYDPVNDNNDYEEWGTRLIKKHFMDDSYYFKFDFPLFEFLNRNKLDYNGLIPMKLALDATGLNIY